MLTFSFACSGGTPSPVQPFSDQEPAASSSESARLQPPAPKPKAKPVAPVDDDDRSGECEKLATAINANGEAFKDAMGKALDPKAKKGALSELATTVEDAGVKVAGLEIKRLKLKGWAQEYKALMAELAGQLRQMDSDGKKKDKAAMKKDVAEVGKIEAKETALTGKINTYCSE
jgi:hypothetical protein